MCDFALPAHVAVVGNGPLTARDRAAINRRAFVVRFNDLKTYAHGDRIDVRVLRYPSAWTMWSPTDVPTWYVSPMHVEAACLTPVYEPQYAEANLLSTVPRLFPSCAACGAACLHNATYAGPSTGGAVLSELQDHAPNVTRIDVYGMNWHGDPTMHVDFRDSKLVRRCCTKCVVHPTASDAYGTPEWLHVLTRTAAPVLCIALAWRYRACCK